MREKAAPQTTLGLSLAATSGIVAVLVMWLWPKETPSALDFLSIAWCLILIGIMQPRIPGGYRMTLGGLYRNIRDDGYRTPLSTKLFALAILALAVYDAIRR